MALDTFKELLIYLKYPNILILNDEEVADVFSAENRHFFIKWSLGKLDPDGELELKSTEKTEDLCEILHQMGIVNSKEVSGYAKVTLKAPEEFGITYRLLHTLKDLSECKDTESEDVKETSIEELNEFVNTNRNLFMNLGPLKSYSQKERLARMATVQADIENLSQEVEALKIEYNANVTKDDLCNDSLINAEAEDNSLQVTDILKQQIDKFMESTKSLNNLNKNSIAVLEISKEVSDKINLCADKLKVSHQFMQNMADIPAIEGNINTLHHTVINNASKQLESEEFIKEMLPLTRKLLEKG